ncbi:hypothetical protein AX14_008289 [Amanita brunnescens Koide BX004]|nr:hypothetical protein AX14_008289 [Amanita brunnescens Koide BX004]
MYKHFAFLASSVTNKNETSSLMVIDTFFFRLITMVPPSQKVIVMLKNQISVVHPRLLKMNTILGIVDYTAVITNSTITENYIHVPPTLDQRYGGEMIAFFAAEQGLVLLEGHLPQVLLELVARNLIRGALTTGIKWHFIVVSLNFDGDGEEYWVSELINWKTKQSSTSREHLVEATSDESDPALIAGVLSLWIPKSFAEWTVPNKAAFPHEFRIVRAVPEDSKVVLETHLDKSSLVFRSIPLRVRKPPPCESKNVNGLSAARKSASSRAEALKFGQGGTVDLSIISTFLCSITAPPSEERQFVGTVKTNALSSESGHTSQYRSTSVTI